MILYTFPIIGLIGTSLYALSHNPEAQIDQTTDYICKTTSAKQHEIFKETLFKDFDFYTSCLDNIRYTSPLVKRRGE